MEFFCWAPKGGPDTKTNWPTDRQNNFFGAQYTSALFGIQVTSLYYENKPVHCRNHSVCIDRRDSKKEYITKPRQNIIRLLENRATTKTVENLSRDQYIRSATCIYSSYD
jgi:hypothetical protein